MHADVTGVTPDEGSVEGGTLITVAGKYFGLNAEGVGVKVGGVDCNIVDVTDTAIKCITGAQPSNHTSFPGGRGIFREVWKDTQVNNDFSNAIWNTSANDYNVEITDQFSSPAEPSFGETDHYSARYRGYFVAPYDGEFRFMIYSDDESELFFSMTENPEDKAKIAFNSRYTNSYYTRPTEQISAPMSLVSGNRYYLEAFFREGWGADYLRVGLLMYDLPYSHSQLSIASDEKQIIQISSTLQAEKQRISINAGNSSIDNFVLTLDGVSSIALSSSSSAEEVRNAVFDMVGVDCQRSGPVGDYFIDYEEEPVGYITGERVTDIEPFCGHVSLKNPNYVYYKDKTKTSDGVNLDSFNAQTAGQICFAYKGAISNKITFKIDWNDGNNDRSNFRNYYIDGLSVRTSWRYVCFNTYDYISEDSWLTSRMKPGSFFDVVRVKLNKDENSAEDFYIDNFNIGAQQVEYMPSPSHPPARPNDILMTDITVEKLDGDFDVTFIAANCGYDYPLLGIKDATVEQGSTDDESVTFSDSSWPDDATITIERIEASSPPVTGNFSLSWKDKYADAEATTTEKKMKEILEKTFGVGKLNVERTGSCVGYSWAVEWLELGGNQPAIELNMTNLNGNEVDASVITEIDGAVTLSPIPGDFMRTPHTIPQVEVVINGIISSCSSENCGYQYNEDLTAIISGIDTHQGSGYENTSITISGSGFSTDAADNVVTIGEANCTVTSATASQIVCDVGTGEAGEYEVKVNVAPGGYASSSGVDVSFNYSLGFVSITPTSGSPAGGTKVTIVGYGFSKDPNLMEVYIGSKECIVTESTFNELQCTITHEQVRRRRRSTNELDVSVARRGQVVTSPNSFTEDSSLAATITSLNQTTSNVIGGDVLAITGNNFGSDAPVVSINGNDCALISNGNTLIECTIPANAPGTYNVIVYIPGVGNAQGDQTITYDFEVTGIFPDHGSLQGGTKVFITGSGFGSNASLVDVNFGHVPCKVMSVEDELIECISGSSGTVHEVTNQGKHEEFGVGYKWTSPNLDIMVGDVVNWQWSTPALVKSIGLTIQQTANEDSVEYDGQGFYAGERSKSGSYSYTFASEGTYFYSSGPVNADVSDEDKVYLLGIVNVFPHRSTSEVIEVSMNNINARHNKSANPRAPTDSNSCPGDDDQISSCNDNRPICNSLTTFCYAFWLCSTAVIEKVEPLSGPANSTITISGSGFSNRACENKVYVGSHMCSVTTSTKTSIECIIETEDSLEVGYIHEISINVKNQGFALNSIETPRNRSFILIPSISSVTPTRGSLAGGTRLTISGDGFSAATADDLRVTIGEGRTCVVESFTYTMITCTTPPQSVDAAEFPIKVTINNRESLEEDVTFTYFNTSTPVVENFTPLSISGSSTTITITGEKFRSNANDVIVTIGGISCIVETVTDTEINCDVGYVAFGTLSVEVYLEGYGLAQLNGQDTIWGSPETYSLSPALGSRKGGTEITINGSGFHVGTTSVRFDNKDCLITSVNVSTIICITDNHGSEEVNVIVTSNEHEFNSLSYEYSNDYTPEVSSVTPSSGESGDIITIAGSDFGSEVSDVQVMIDDEMCTVVSVSSTEIRCEVPSHVAGVYVVDVTVYNFGIAASEETFEYNLAITGSSPVDGSFAGQKNLNITGSGFNGVSTIVTVCGNPCEVKSGTFTTLQCVLPANENIDSSPLNCDIVVAVSDDTNVTSSGSFSYDASLTATIDSVTPARGGTGGGTELVITGSGFRSSGNMVTIDGSECTISSESSTMIECTTEAHQGSVKTKVRVVVDDEDNIATQENAEFYYVDVWSSRWTWKGKDPPIEGEFVAVQAGQTILLDVDTPILAFLLIAGGSLIFDEANIELHAENILIMDGGLLQVGTEADPFQHKATIMMHGHQRSIEIPLYGAKTLAVRNGTLDLHGIPIPITWTHLAETAEAGDTTLVLEESVTWNVGDKIAIASTGHRHSQNENEMLTITGISNDGLTLTIEPPLKYTHISLEQTIDGVFLSTKAEVGVLTRNVVVRGSVQDEWTEDIEACNAEFDTNQFATQTCFQGRFGEEIGSDQFGSQIMLFGKYQNQQLVTGRIEYVEVTHAGSKLIKHPQSITITHNLWVVADVKLPVMRKLFIYGTLELQDDRSNTINATYIFIHGGSLIIGWPETPFEHQVNIFLNGNHFTEDIPLPNGPNMGSKVLGVFGRLEMHGTAPNVAWTKLATTVNPGSDVITLTEDVDWGEGKEIVITSTSYEAWETETFTIAEVVNARTLRLNDTLNYKHIAETHTLSDGSLTYTEAAEVGLLSRNIRIIGADYNNLFEESFGARVLVGKFVQEGLEYKGYAQISNVEFYHSGQEGWTDFYDPRYSVAFLDTGEVTVANPSYVRSCTFHNGFSPAIGVFGASGVLIEDNVIHHTVGAGIIAWGTDHKITGNLVSLTVFPGTYQDRFLLEDKTWPAGIEVQMSFGIILANNTVAGSEKLLYRVSGEKCFEEKVWENNEGHSSLGGLMMLPPDGHRQCSMVSNFYLWKNWFYGIYLETTCSLVVSEVILADNKIGILPYIYRPPAISHDVSEKSFTIEDSFIIGTSPFFDCDEWQNEPENANQCTGVHAPPLPPGGGNIGFMMTNFMSGSNNAPVKAFHGIKNYPAISGITQLKGITFAHFQEGCSARDYSIAPNNGNQDGIHPSTATGTSFVSVDKSSRVFFFRPNVHTANPADCVDMTCDAMRKVFIKDLDGGILGSPGTVIPDSAFQWGGDPRYGLGDYRIPKMMVTNTDGSRIPYEEKCPHKGIIGTEDCTWNADWQAYECHDLDYMMLIIESMDPDTEVRRLSPIAMYSEGYVDLINGPQDHGWCHGYTCQERISTFMSVVATGKQYEMYMSSTNPQRLRLHLLNATPEQKVVVGIWYANPQRLDVYYQGLYIMPNNGRIDGGSFIWVDKDPNLPDDQFLPTPASNIYGENYFDRKLQTLWVLVRGNQPLDIITTPVIMVAIGVPAVAVDDFFEENLVQNLANLLGIDKSRIRVVDVVREGSSRRRKRSDDSVAEVVLEVGNAPATSIELEGNSTLDANITDSSSFANYTEGNSSLGFNDLVAIQAQIVDAAQTGELGNSLNVSIESLSMSDPVEPATDPTNGERATNETGGSEEGDTLYGDSQEEEDIPLEVQYQFPSGLTISQAPSGVSENWPFVVGVSVLDTQGEIVQNLGHSSSPWRMKVSLRAGSGPAGAHLLGNTTIDIINGLANFTNIKLDEVGSGYILDFAVVYPNSTTLIPISSEAFSVAERMFAAVVNTQPTGDVMVGEKFDVGFDLVDVLSGLQVTTLESAGYNWSASIELYQPSNYFGSLNGNKTVEIDLMLASALFTDLSIDDIGFQYILEITITTIPSSFHQISQQLNPFDIISARMVTHTGEPMQVTLRFLADYDTVASGNEDNIAIYILNTFSRTYINVTISDIQVSRGSILVSFTMVGDVENTAASIYNDLQAGRITLYVDGSTIEADQDYMLVDGEIYGPSDAEESSGVPLWAIILVVVILILVVLIITFVIYKYFYNPNNKLAAVETMRLTEKEEAPRTSSFIDGGRETPVFKIDSPDIDGSNSEETRPLKDETSSTRSKSPGFNHPCRSPELVSTALPPGFADGAEEHVKEDRANMYIMELTSTRSFEKLGQMAVNLVGTLSDLRKEIKVMLTGSNKEKPFVLLTETLKDIDGASEKRQVVHETYASDSVLLRFMEDTDIAKLCVCGLVGQFECSLCRKQIYCSPQCQSSDWAKHILSCNSDN
ncbi:fibrocystin-L-like [Anneissia japonica]|uniref:fibrocystin-L-like n=1 Tax=Anneissia japonica TaxID=1529436 RepID=UPI001425ADC4|nr:fibrocystin-L-like [Anneissia japonica]